MSTLQQQIALRQGHSVDAESHLYFERVSTEADLNLSGTLRGPFCEYAKTLPAEFKLQFIEGEQFAAEVVVTDPCYWTPELPFLYHLSLDDFPGTQYEIGLRRWGADGPHLRLEGKRTVLRGGEVADFGAEHIEPFRQSASTLMMKEWNLEMCQLATSHGIPVVLDLRGTEDDIEKHFVELTWCPAVVLMLLNAEQLDALRNRVKDIKGHLKAHCISSNTENSNIINDSGDLVVVELGPDEVPPSWLADSRQPVVGIRTGTMFSNAKSMRALADSLQADLAPTFDFAGYLVTS